MRKVSQILGFSVPFLFLSACSGYQGDWPKLNAPLPEKSGKQVQNARPSTVIRPFDSFSGAAASVSDTAQHFQTLKNSLDTELKELKTAIEAMQSALRDQQQVKPANKTNRSGGVMQRQKEKLDVAWGYLNLRYTRLSQGLRSLKDLRDALGQTQGQQETLNAVNSLIADIETQQTAARQLLGHTPS